MRNFKALEISISEEDQSWENVPKLKLTHEWLDLCSFWSHGIGPMLMSRDISGYR